MTAWAFPAAGILLLLLLGGDVFGTAFHPVGRGGPINRRQNRLIWKMIRAMGSFAGERRDGVLSLAGPLMAVITIVVWSLLLLAGFTLIYLPFIRGFHFSPGTPGGAWLEAFYYSGIIAATLGQGDVVAPHGWLRVATVIQAMAGFAAITVAVSYVLAIYRELIAAQTLATSIDARLSGPASAGSGEAADWDRTLAVRLAHVIESHHNYPILHYFRPPRRQRSVPLQVARLHAGLQRRMESDDSLSARALAAIIRRYADEMHVLFVNGGRPGDGAHAADEHLADVLEMMGYPRQMAGR